MSVKYRILTLLAESIADVCMSLRLLSLVSAEYHHVARSNAVPPAVYPDLPAVACKKGKVLGGEYVKAALVLAGTEERVGESVVAPEYPALVVYQRHRQRKAHQSLVVGVVDGFVQPVVVRIFIQAYLEQLAQRKPRNQDKQRQGYQKAPG